MLKKICIAGINGYTGQLLKKYIANHPELSLIGSLKLSETSAIDKDVFQLNNLTSENFDIDFLVLATPADISIQIIKTLKQKNIDINILDLSGAFRLPINTLKNWYNLEHDIDSLKNGAKYGLSPYVKYDEKDKVIANPGCYPTCALLSLLPLLKAGVIKPKNIIIDAKSGVSGAGKKPRQDLMFIEMLNNYFPYKINKHQHIPEILQGLKEFKITEEELFFTTSMLPIHSGIAMCIYADLNLENLSKHEQKNLVKQGYSKEFKNYPLFKLVDIEDAVDDELNSFLAIKSVANTPNMHLGFAIKGSKLMLFSSIDNLLKGAVTQAIENLNNYYNFPINTGLGG